MINMFFLIMMLLSSFTAVSQVNLTFQPIKDAGIGFKTDDNSANTNYGTATHFSAFTRNAGGGVVNSARCIFEFDLSAIPQGSLINNATLKLYAYGPLGGNNILGHTGNSSCVIERVEGPWSESVVTWNNQPGTVNINSVNLPSATNALQNYENIDLTEMVQFWVDSPTRNNGALMKLVNESPTNALVFCSREYSNSSKRPVLEVDYCCALSSKTIGFDEFVRVNESELIISNANSTPLKLSIYSVEGRLVFETLCEAGVTKHISKALLLKNSVNILHIVSGKESFTKRYIL